MREQRGLEREQAEKTRLMFPSPDTKFPHQGSTVSFPQQKGKYSPEELQSYVVYAFLFLEISLVIQGLGILSPSFLSLISLLSFL